MPKVQFVNQVEDIRITRIMQTPKRMSEVAYWFKAARKAIPQIPEINTGEWRIENADANLTYVNFTLRSREGIRAYVVIERKVNTL